MVLAASRAALGLDSAASTMAGRCRYSSPAEPEFGAPDSQKATLETGQSLSYYTTSFEDQSLPLREQQRPPGHRLEAATWEVGHSCRVHWVSDLWLCLVYC